MKSFQLLDSMIAAYSIEILSCPNSTKAYKLLIELSSLETEALKAQLERPPWRLRSQLPLAEALDLERRLQKLGISVRIVKINENDKLIPKQHAQADETVHATEDVIEIPEAHVREVPASHPPPPPTKVRLELRKIPLRSQPLRGVFILGAFLIIVVISWLFISSYQSQRVEMEAHLAISNWQQTLLDQDRLLDSGTTPAQILLRLDELERRISRLLAQLPTSKSSALLRERFDRAYTEMASARQDLLFMRQLEADGYPIHPSCMLDQGYVQGCSDLPEGTLFRVQLLLRSEMESSYYPTHISGGTFRLRIDPILANEVYDARATVAPFSQQPISVQRWALRRAQFGSSQASFDSGAGEAPGAILLGKDLVFEDTIALQNFDSTAISGLTEFEATRMPPFEDDKLLASTHVENALMRELKSQGYPQAQVFAIRSASVTETYIIEVELQGGSRSAAIGALIQALFSSGQRRPSVHVDRLSLRHDERISWWIEEQLRYAIHLLPGEDGKRRAVSYLELSASSIAPP